MKLDKNIDILIVGLGLIGGSYAKGFRKKGYKVSAIDVNEQSIRFAIENGIIDKGSSKIDEFDIFIYYRGDSCSVLVETNDQEFYIFNATIVVKKGK